MLLRLEVLVFKGGGLISFFFVDRLHLSANKTRLDETAGRRPKKCKILIMVVIRGVIKREAVYKCTNKDYLPEA